MGKKKQIVEEVNWDQTEGVDRFPDVYREYIPDQIASFQKIGKRFIFQSDNGIKLLIRTYSDKIFRLHYSIEGEVSPDFSYAVAPEFKGSRHRAVVAEEPKYYSITTRFLECRVHKKGLKVDFYDKMGNALCRDSKGFYAKATIMKGVREVSITKKGPKKEHYFGLGDKSCSLDLRGQKLENWTTDAFGFGPQSDPLYRAIPFYYGLYKKQAYGIFLDNSYRSHFHFADHKRPHTRFSAEGGELNYYFIFGPELSSVAEQYTDLTGRPELAPVWALGFHQCRWSYYPESRVMELAADFRKHKIPCDAIYLDIDYMDGYRCFTWNKEYFPAPKRMMDSLQKKGFHTVVMIDPGIREDEDYKVFVDGKKKGYFCTRPDGEIMKGPVWPPNCAFPDFTNPEVRVWWGRLYKELYQLQGVSGFWNDMNEPAVFKVNRLTFPDDIRHHHEGHPASHKKAHNIYGLNMSRATYDGLKRLKPRKRPFLLTRATFSGGQRYAAVWTGDNIASWEHLMLANRQCQRLSISGFSFCGTDIGGFVDMPSGELFVRWLQLSIFHPLFRVHSMGNNADGSGEVDEEGVKIAESIDRMDQEPWAFGEPYTTHARKAIEDRYRWLPVIYTAFWKYSQQGTPMIRSLVFYDQTDPLTYNREREFLFGDHLLVSPVLKEKQASQKVYLPKGEWYNYRTNKKFKGKQKIKIKTSLEQIPVFVKAGAVFPHYPVQQHTNQKIIRQLSLQVYFSTETCKSQLYEDAGEGYDYRREKYSLRTYTTSGTADSFQILQEKEGKMQSTYPSVKLTLIGLPFTTDSCQIDDKVVVIKEEKKDGKTILSFIAPVNFKSISLITKV